ncbi:MAG: hypothetical protein U0Y68_14235 [Blastocatellia bacterium]
MKKSITMTLTMILLCTATLLAQSGRAPKQPSEQRPPDLRGIDLTDDQKASLKTIRDNTEQQIQAVRNNQTLSDAEKHEQIEALHNNARQQSQGVLTPEQQQTLGNRQGENQRGNQGGPARIPNLTDEQKGQLQTIRQQEREQIDAVRNNSTLSDAEKRSQIDTIRQNSREQAQGVLTPEQRQAVGNRSNGGRPGEMGGQQGGRGPQGGQAGGSQGQPGGFGGGRMGGPSNQNGGFGGAPGGFGGGRPSGGMGGGPRGGRP